MTILRILTIVYLFIIRCRFPKLKSLPEIIRYRYGNKILKVIRKFEKLDYRLRKICTDIDFLNACVTYNLTPTFLRYRLSSKRLQRSNSYEQSQKLFLQEEISFKNVEKMNILGELKKIEQELKSVINTIDWNHISHKFIDGNIKAIKRVEHVQNYKLSQLMGEKLHHDPNEVIYNYSSYDLTESEKSLLVKGLNFSLPPRKLRFENHLLPFELLYRNIRDDESTDESLIHLKSKIKDVGLSSLRLYNKKDHRFENISEKEFNAFSNLKNNKNIVIQKADKGNSVVILDRSIYISKMELLLNDSSKFEKIIFNKKHKTNAELRHILDMEKAIKFCLDDLLDNGYISKEDFKYLKPCGSKPGIMYGMCKVHKVVDDVDKVPPFRPILSAIGTCTYNLAKFFVPILKEFTINKYTVKDSFSFSSEIRDQDHTLHMASFDVQSLFTNIPLDETIDICVEKVFNKKRKIKGLLKRHFKELLSFSVKSSCFLFNGVYYKQTDGVSMGSPLGPTLANMFLAYHEDIWLENCPLQFRPKYYRRYVDDIFLMFDDKDHVKKFLRYMNSRHKNIQFTCEEEDENKISFLDVTITRTADKLITSLYRKKTFSGVYLNHNSFLPSDYKKGLIHTLLFRAYNICSDYVLLHNEIEYLKSGWQKNSFPLFFIDSCVKKFFDKLFIIRKTSNSVPQKKEVFICLEYLGKISLQCKKQLVEIFRTCKPNIKLNVVFKSSNKIRHAFRFKDQVSKSINSNVIYKFTCSICKDAYIGETKRHLLVRQYEHLGKSISTEKPLKYNEKDATAVRKHCNNHKHEADINCFSILGSASNNFHLKLKESLLIMKFKPSLNLAKESLPLYLFNNDSE